jgi:hypothetical protein
MLQMFEAIGARNLVARMRSQKAHPHAVPAICASFRYCHMHAQIKAFVSHRAHSSQEHKGAQIMERRQRVRGCAADANL